MNSKLALRNVSEVVTQEEFDALAAEKKSPTVYCGFEVSGAVHLGHLVAIQKLVDFLDAGFKVKVLLADVHTQLNIKDVDTGEMSAAWEKTFKALGLGKAEFVRGSSFQFEREYVEDVLKLAAASTLKRALRSMQEVARDIENARTSQVIYPLMQAADVKALGVDVAYGGMEQRKIHMLARELLPALGAAKPVCVHTPLLSSLKGPDSKMSSSEPASLVAVDEEPDSILKKIGKAHCPPEADGNPVLGVAKLVVFPKLGKLEVARPEKYGGDLSYESYDALLSDYSSKKLHAQDLKNAVAEALAGMLEPARK